MGVQIHPGKSEEHHLEHPLRLGSPSPVPAPSWARVGVPVPPLPCVSCQVRAEVPRGELFLLSCNWLQEEGQEVSNMAGALQLKSSDTGSKELPFLGSSSCHRPYRAISCSWQWAQLDTRGEAAWLYGDVSPWIFAGVQLELGFIS